MGKVLIGAVLLIWAGALLGGSFIAAPAKFQVEELSLQLALQVGEAQFFWLMVGESAFCVLTIVLFVVLRRVYWLAALPITLFLVQQLVVMPLLSVRTETIINGGVLDGSNLHLIYILLETAKLLALIGVAFAVLRAGNRKSPNEVSDERRIPSGYKQYSETPIYDMSSVPSGLLKDHDLKPGTFGLLSVIEGSVVYFQSQQPTPLRIVGPSQDLAILPQEKHYIRLSEDARFKVAFFRRSKE